MRIMSEKVFKNQKIRSVNLWNDFHRKLEEAYQKGMPKSDTIKKCLRTEVNLDMVIQEQGIVIELDTLNISNGMKTCTLSFKKEEMVKEKLFHKMHEIKEIIPSFTVSVITNLCMMFPFFTVDFLLENIKGKKEYKNIDKIDKKEASSENPKDIPEDILKHVQEIGKNYSK